MAVFKTFGKVKRERLEIVMVTSSGLQGQPGQTH